ALITEMLEKGAWPPLLVPWFRVDLGRLTPWGRFVQLVRRSDAAFYAELAGRREGGARGDDILSLLLEARHEDGSPMRDDEVRDQLVTLLVAGHETTATALAWAVRWLAASPPLWSRLAAEVATAAGADGRLDAARVAKLELLDATVKETLRLSPVVPMVGRYLVKPARVGGWELPARVAVMPSIYLVHRRPDLYPNPTRFDPDRFVGVKPSPYAWFPFGGGIRRCVGMAFALYEMKMVLASIVHRTRLALDGPPVRVVRRSITLAPSDGLRVRLLAKRARAAAPSRAAGLDAAHA
ncbi:MAG TPA: cytochrome P450, partial [Minicystis sp.]|nr:cytochrome P450 [Minicystis sp.]